MRCSRPWSGSSPRATWSHPDGGLFCWATLPGYIDTTDLLAKALRENVAFVPGAAAYVDGRGGVDAAQLLGLGRGRDPRGDPRIGRVISEQMELYQSITGEHRLLEPPPDDGARRPARSCRCAAR